MNKRVLVNILNVLLFLIAVSILFGMAFLILQPQLGLDWSVGTKDDAPLSELSTIAYILLGLNLFFYLVFFYGLWFFRKAALALYTSGIRQIPIITYVNKAGKAFIISAVFWWFLGGMSNLLLREEIRIAVGEKTFFYLFLIATGVFLMLMSTVFNQAIAHKEENELTI